MAYYDSGLDDDQAALPSTPTDQLTALGIDPDEANLDRANALAKVSQTPMQRQANGEQSAADPGPQPPSRTTTVPPAWRPPMAAPSDDDSSAPQPASRTAASVSPTGASSATSPLAGQFAETALGVNKTAASALEDARNEANSIPATDTQSESLEQQLASDTASKPQAKNPDGSWNPAYKPSIGRRILRGVQGAVEGLAMGGIPGAVVGAIDPRRITGPGTGYGDGNAQYGRDVAQNERAIASDTQQLNDSRAAFKAAQDARKARASELRATGTVAKDVTAGLAQAQNAQTDAVYKPAEAYNNSPAAKISVANAKPPQNYEEMVAASLDPNRSPIERARFKMAAAEIRQAEIRKFQGAGSGGGSVFPGAGGNGGSGADYLKTLPPGTRDQVQAIGEGRMAPPSSRSKQGMALLNAVAQAYPGYDATQYPTYLKTRQAFTSGSVGNAINSFATAIKHLNALESHLPGNTSIPLLNRGLNAYRSASGSAALKPFQADAEAVSNEVSKAYKGGAITQSEHDHMQALLSQNDSPAQMKANIAEFRNLLQGKLQSYQDQWESAMPKGAVSPLETLVKQGAGPEAPTGSFDWNSHPVAK